MKYFNQIALPQYPTAAESFLNMVRLGIIKWDNRNQICLTTTEDEPDNYLLGCASLVYDWSKKTELYKDGATTIVVPRRDTPLTESSFNTLCSQFKNTIFEDIVNMLNQHYDCGRIRIMKSDPKTCLSWHTDSSKRLHYPLITQEGCFMVIDDEIMHIPQDTWWLADTNHMHTAFNASMSSRLHIVTSIL